MNGFYKGMIAPVALAVGLTGLAARVQASERSWENGKWADTSCITLSLNGDNKYDNFCAIATGDEKSAQMRISFGVGNAIGRLDVTELESFAFDPKYTAVGIDKRDVNGDGKKDAVLNYGPAENPMKHVVTYLNHGDGTMSRQK